MNLSNLTKTLTGTLLVFLAGCDPASEPAGNQEPTPIVSTVSKPIEKQWRGTWTFQDSTTFFSNEFDGARLSGVVNDSADTYTIVISSENSPINPSPWYAFKVWSTESREIQINFTYRDSKNRYYPKVSRDGINFLPLDTARYTPVNTVEDEFGINAVAERISIRVEVNPEPLWVAGQELYSSTDVKAWIDTISEKDFASLSTIGKSKEGRDMHMVAIGNEVPKKALLIISRQHPPEVTGFLAMKSFIETISGDSDLAVKFREQFVTFVVPLMNPDGVDNGHWRHSAGGIDLNRDWQAFNQPETSNVKRFLEAKTSEGFDFVFAGDFHSTWEDIYYPLDSALTDDDGKIIYDWIARIAERLPQKAAIVRPSKTLDNTMVSRNYFYKQHGIPAIVFELGDNTPRDFLKEKGQVAAEELMQLLLN